MSRKRDRITAICQQCDKSFEVTPSIAKRGGGKFCSRRCYGQAITGKKNQNWQGGKPVAACQQCGKDFKTSNGNIRQGFGKFCSRACQGQWRSENWIGASNPSWNRTTTHCEQCGKNFEIWPSTVANGGGRFCSRVCKDQWQGKNQRGKNNPRWKEKIPTTCEQCGARFEVWPGIAKQGGGRFCSTSCQNQWQSEYRVGENSANWKGGAIDYYGPNWPTQRRLARRRDRYTCQHCGITQKKLGQKLDVHHIKPFREFGYDPDENDHYLQANELTNLISLCPSCHHRAEHGNVPVQPYLL